MKVRRNSGESPLLVIEEIEPFFLDLLRRLPDLADPGENPAARARLFSAPMARGGDGDEFNEDWERYVDPEIRALLAEHFEPGGHTEVLSYYHLLWGKSKG